MALNPVIAQLIANQEAPDLLGSFERGREAKRQAQERAAAAQSKQLAGQILGGQFSAGSQMAELAGVNPQAALQMAQALDIPTNDTARLQNAANVINRTWATAQTDPDRALQDFVAERDRLNMLGISTRHMNQLIDQALQDPQGALETLSGAREAFVQAELIKPTQAEEDARLLGLEEQKTAIDLQAKRELEAEKQAVELQKARLAASGKGKELTAREKDLVRYQALLKSDPDLAAQFGRAAGFIDAETNVVKLLEDRKKFKPGTPERQAIDIELGLTGEAGEDPKAAAERARAVKLAEVSIKRADEAFERIPAIRTSIGNIDEAISAIDAGAKTGTLNKFLPTLRNSTKRLKNVARRMGLDIIGAVTFGALSKGELDLAMATALPDDLPEQELRSWLVDRKRAQELLATELEDMAIFLSSGGTIDEWLEDNKSVVEVDF